MATKSSISQEPASMINGIALRDMILEAAAEIESKKELINNAVNALGIEKSRTIMIGDRLFDIIGANEAEVESIGAVFGYGSEEELKEAGATYLVSHADEIRNIIFSEQFLMPQHKARRKQRSLQASAPKE